MPLSEKRICKHCHKGIIAKGYTLTDLKEEWFVCQNCIEEEYEKENPKKIN